MVKLKLCAGKSINKTLTNNYLQFTGFICLNTVPNQLKIVLFLP